MDWRHSIGLSKQAGFGKARGCRVSCIFGVVTWCESNVVPPRRCVLIVTMIIGMIVFLWRVSIIIAVEKIVEIFESVCVKITFTMERVVVDVVLGE